MNQFAVGASDDWPGASAPGHFFALASDVHSTLHGADECHVSAPQNWTDTPPIWVNGRGFEAAA
jgi:hypothetical protein